MNRFCKSLVSNMGQMRAFVRTPMLLSPPPSPPRAALSTALSIVHHNQHAFKLVPDGSGYVRFYVTQSDARLKFGQPRPRSSRLAAVIENDEQYADAEPVEAVGHDVSFVASDAAARGGFAEYDLPEPLLKKLAELGYNNPFEIQAATLKHTLAGKDVVGKAFTGSGKTLAFAIPIITRVLRSENRTNKNPKCLVLTPTRELCLQLFKTIQELAPQLSCASIIGGAGYEAQIRKLSDGVDIVVATPGRLRDLIQRKNFIPDDIELVCLDEADEMLTPNFLDQIQDVIEASRKDKQMLMFSATMNHNVSQLINDYMKDPIFVDLTKGKSQKLPANIEHYMYRAPSHKQAQLAAECIKKFNSKRCIVFVNQKIIARTVDMKLGRSGLRTGALHSDIGQFKREKILNDFRSGRLQVIVATDVASRGIDVPEVDLIIQLEAPPNGVDYYVHRSGRTGRAGRAGKSVLIHSGSDKDFTILKELSRLVKFKTIDLPKLEGSDDDYEAEYGQREERPYRRPNYGNRDFGDRDRYESRPPWKRQSSWSPSSPSSSYQRRGDGEFKKFGSGGGSSYSTRYSGGDNERRFSRPLPPWKRNQEDNIDDDDDDEFDSTDNKPNPNKLNFADRDRRLKFQ